MNKVKAEESLIGGLGGKFHKGTTAVQAANASIAIPKAPATICSV
jgi:hypothetical protein